jgi:hypothetical protein
LSPTQLYFFKLQEKVQSSTELTEEELDEKERLLKQGNLATSDRMPPSVRFFGVRLQQLEPQGFHIFL